MVMPANEQPSPARDFYRECMIQSFRHTGLFAAQVGRAAADIVETPKFAAVLRECPVGSLDAARRIGDIASVYLDSAPNQPGPWWRELCAYDRSYFMQVATTQQGPPVNRPRRGVSALCATFKWIMPELVARLKAGEAIGADLHRNITLLFARGHDGNVRVVEVGPPVEKVFRATNGLRTIDQIAAAAEIEMDEVRKILAALAEIGAVEAAKTQEQMLEAIQKTSGDRVVEPSGH
jgi:hypothetical protein